MAYCWDCFKHLENDDIQYYYHEPLCKGCYQIRMDEIKKGQISFNINEHNFHSIDEYF